MLLVSLDGYPAGPFYDGVNSPEIPAEQERFALRGLLEAYLAAGVSEHVDAQAILTEDMLTAMLAVHHNTGKLVSSAVQERFDGDLILVTCAEADGDIRMPEAASWKPYIAGDIDTFAVPGNHGQMLLPEAAALIGNAVTRRLEAHAPRSPMQAIGAAGFVTSNPFEGTAGPFHIVCNGDGQHSLWPAFAAIPVGWRPVFGPGSREACRAYVEREWAV